MPNEPAYPAEFDYDAPDNCVVCDTPLNIEEEPFFCSIECEKKHVEEQRAEDNAYVAAMHEAAAYYDAMTLAKAGGRRTAL